jgi:predicted transcriptional regulator
MTTKEKMIAAIESLPTNASIEDAMDRLLFMAKFERGLEEADSGMTLSHDKVRKRMAKWLS